jgi:nucleoside-diphosphate kinase
MTTTERTMAILKPDGVEKRLLPHVLLWASDVQLHPVDIRLCSTPMSLTFWQSFYREHEGKPFYPGLCDFMNSGPCAFIELEGPEAIAAWRDVMGPTDPTQSGSGTLRGRWGTELPRNVVHGSDSPEAYKRERELIYRVLDAR